MISTTHLDPSVLMDQLDRRGGTVGVLTTWAAGRTLATVATSQQVIIRASVISYHHCQGTTASAKNKLLATIPSTALEDPVSRL
jgi:hypothetical protein